MKGGMKLHQLQQKRKDEEDEWALTCQGCAICNKVLAGAYGQWSQPDETTLWTCSKTCDELYREKRDDNARRGISNATQGV